MGKDYRANLRKLESALYDFRHNVRSTGDLQNVDQRIYDASKSLFLLRAKKRNPLNLKVKRRRHKQVWLNQDEVARTVSPLYPGCPVTIQEKSNFLSYHVSYVLGRRHVVVQRQDPLFRNLMHWTTLEYRGLRRRNNNQFVGFWFPMDLSCRESYKRDIRIHPHYTIDTVAPALFEVPCKAYLPPAPTHSNLTPIMYETR